MRKITEIWTSQLTCSFKESCPNVRKVILIKCVNFCILNPIAKANWLALKSQYNIIVILPSLVSYVYMQVTSASLHI